MPFLFCRPAGIYISALSAAAFPAAVAAASAAAAIAVAAAAAAQQQYQPQAVIRGRATHSFHQPLYQV